MSSSWYREETSPQLIAWLEGLKADIPQWSDPKRPKVYPYSPHFFMVESMRQRGFSVLPLNYFWSPSEDRTLPIFQKMNVDRIYTAGFSGETERYFSSGLDTDSIECMQNEHLGYCLNVPANESFLILNTYLDYYILAAQFQTLQGIVNQPLERSLDEFIETVREEESFEASKDFAEAITNLYRRHNRDMQSRSS